MNWISVKDRMPKYHEFVLIVTSEKIWDKYIHAGHWSPSSYFEKSWWVRKSWSLEHLIGEKFEWVTHWSPLPDKPIEKFIAESFDESK
jgi:Protein of unknown function (DUF551)